jgi:hypothetical protein
MTGLGSDIAIEIEKIDLRLWAKADLSFSHWPYVAGRRCRCFRHGAYGCA